MNVLYVIAVRGLMVLLNVVRKLDVRNSGPDPLLGSALSRPNKPPTRDFVLHFTALAKLNIKTKYHAAVDLYAKRMYKCLHLSYNSAQPAPQISR